MVRIVPYVQSAYTLMIPEEPLSLGKLHGVATEVLSCLKKIGGLLAWHEPQIYMKSIASHHFSLSNKGLRSETYGCSPTT